MNWLEESIKSAKSVPAGKRDVFFTLLDAGIPFMDAFPEAGLSFQQAHGLHELRRREQAQAA